MREQFLAFASDFMRTHPTTAVDGEYYELPGKTVYLTAAQPLPEKGRLEVNHISPDAPADFEWEYEITIKDKLAGEFIHLLLRRDASIVETYGKTVTPVDETRGQEILTILGKLAD